MGLRAVNVIPPSPPAARTARPEAAGGLLRREPDPADRRGAPADPSQAGADRALRL
jgi:hypothetical protein